MVSYSGMDIERAFDIFRESLLPEMPEM